MNRRELRLELARVKSERDMYYALYRARPSLDEDMFFPLAIVGVLIAVPVFVVVAYVVARAFGLVFS